MTRFKGNKEETLALNTFVKLARCANTVSADIHAHLLGRLTTSQFAIMEALYHLGPLVQKDLAQKILKSPGNITTIINNLERAGLVIRTMNNADKRFCSIRLTDKGKSVIKRLFPVHADIIVKRMAVLTDKEQETLAGLLKKLGLTAPQENADLK